MISIITGAYFNGVSTRKMNKLFSDMGIADIDRSLVSRWPPHSKALLSSACVVYLSLCFVLKLWYVWIPLYTAISSAGLIAKQAKTSTVTIQSKPISCKGKTIILPCRSGSRHCRSCVSGGRFADSKPGNRQKVRASYRHDPLGESRYQDLSDC